MGFIASVSWRLALAVGADPATKLTGGPVLISGILLICPLTLGFFSRCSTRFARSLRIRDPITTCGGAGAGREPTACEISAAQGGASTEGLFRDKAGPRHVCHG
jgi:hypothetical protein